MKHAFIICLVSFASTIGAAQTQYVPLGAMTAWADGYVVTTQNDTIDGQVRVSTLVNESPASVIVRTPDDKKSKLKGEGLRRIVQRIPKFAYSTGYVPREQEEIVFERVPDPRHAGKSSLLERLTPAGGSMAVYFDALGWKRTMGYSFGNFTISHQRDLSYVVLKNNQQPMVVERGDLNAVYEQLFGDCPAFVRLVPTATRRDWVRFGELVAIYNQQCQPQ